MIEPIPLYAGFDQREAAGYHTFVQSVMDRASVPVAFIPLHGPMIGGIDGQRDGTNAFIYSRFMIPYLQRYNGWAIFCDGADMLAVDDIAKLWAEREKNWYDKAVVVVKHDYKTKHKRKYIGTPMEADNGDYPRKNWSSLILWNCNHYANRRLTPDVVTTSPGSFLHRFEWLRDDQIGELPAAWNVLIGEQSVKGASLLHFTAGIPAFKHYANCDGAHDWHETRKRAFHVIGE